MREAFVEISGVPTKITTWGRWIEETNLGDSKDLVILIPGNPGVTGFYNQFAETVHKKLGYTVWCVGHAGHNLPLRRVNPIPKMEKHKDLYGLKGQIEHKVEFFEKYVPKDAKVHIIGHSIGCYIILELLQHPPIKNIIENAYFLFPTLENMAATSNGKFLCNFIRHIIWLILFLAFIFSILPSIVQKVLLYIYMFITGIQDKKFHRSNMTELIKPGVLRRVFFLAFEEMEQVKEPNFKSIRENVDKIKFYYSDNDGWAPLAYCDNLKRNIPNINYEIVGINHAFVLNQSIIVANTVSEWMRK